MKHRAIDLNQDQNSDFDPTFATEKLDERGGISVDREAPRRWLTAKGLWEVRRNRRRYRE